MNPRRVLTPPTDLSEPALLEAVEAGWSLRATRLTYRPVGFGSHHWELTDPAGDRWWITVDDLRTRRLSTDEPLTGGYLRLRAALTAAQALHDAGHDFVVAPCPTIGGEPVARLADSFAVAVFPFVDGESFTGGTYSAAHRRAVLDLIVAVHAAPPEVRDRALVDDYAIPCRDTITARIDGNNRTSSPPPGPYARAAAELLAAHAPAVRRELARYDALVRAARVAPPELVLTHGEPHSANTMRTENGWVLIDWDTAQSAPPERDLWDLDQDDPQLCAEYTAGSGRSVRADLLDLYRIRWDLTEVALCLARFQAPHGTTADDEETWTVLSDTVRAVATRQSSAAAAVADVSGQR